MIEPQEQKGIQVLPARRQMAENDSIVQKIFDYFIILRIVLIPPGIMDSRQNEIIVKAHQV